MIEKEKCKGKIETKNMRSKKMERLLFESKGAPTKAVVMSGVGGGILAVLGIVIIVISQMKHATHSVYSGVYGGAMSYSGSYGGGYLVGEGARTMLIVFGVVSILAAIASLCSLFGIAKTRLMVYDYHLEGSYYIPILGLTIRRDYYVKYQDIAGITRNQNVLIIHMVGTQQRIAVKNNQMAETAHQMIQQCIDYMKYSQQNQGTVN